VYTGRVTHVPGSCLQREDVVVVVHRESNFDVI
jgi:hypothetical protein